MKIIICENQGLDQQMPVSSIILLILFLDCHVREGETPTQETIETLYDSLIFL